MRLFSTLMLLIATGLLLIGCVTTSPADPAYGYQDPYYQQPNYPQPTYPPQTYPPATYPPPGRGYPSGPVVVTPPPPPPPPGRGRGNPGPIPPQWPAGESAAAVSNLEVSVERLNAIVNGFGPDNYQNLRREVQEMRSRLTVVQQMISNRESANRVNNAFTDVERAAAVIDGRLRTFSNPQILYGWSETVSALQYASKVLDYRASNNWNRPIPGNLPNAEIVRASDNLLISIDAYLRQLTPIAPSHPNADAVKNRMDTMRKHTEALRQSARNSTANRNQLRDAINEIVNRYNDSATYYTRLVEANPNKPQYASPLFNRVGESITQLQQTIR